MFQQKSTKHGKRWKPQSEETNQASEPDSDIAEMLELSDWDLIIIIITILRVLMEKVDNTQELMSNVSTEMDTLKKNQKEC